MNSMNVAHEIENAQSGLCALMAAAPPESGRIVCDAKITEHESIVNDEES
jgi:hypothetical protein